MPDPKQIELLDAARQARNAAPEHAQVLNDEAFQLELQAQMKRALARRIVQELNEQVPSRPDPS